MVNADGVRRLAMMLADVTDETAADRLAFSYRGKSFAWTFLQRVSPRRPRVPRLDILAVRCPIERKEMLIAAEPEVYFDDDHYRGFPAVLVRLEAISIEELGRLLEGAAREIPLASRLR